MSSRTVVVNRNDRVVVFLGHRAYGVVDSFLHLRVGPLNGVQLYGVVVFACCYGRYRASAHSDTVVVSSQQDDVVSFGRTVLGRIGHFGEAYTASQHYHLVIAVFALRSVRIMFRVLECLERAADQGLAELVAEVGRSVGGFDQYLRGRLVQPFARRAGFPLPSVVNTGVGGHVHRCAGNGE